MQAGRELDALVAEKVMGHCVKRGAENIPRIWSVQRGWDRIPDYSTDIAAAWGVVPILDQHLDRFWSIVRVGKKFEFYCNPYQLGDYPAYVESATLPLLLYTQ